jgi:hypothetical protein
VDLVGRELESPPCCATSVLVGLDPPANSWTGGNDVSMSRLRSARGCLAAHLSCCQPTLAACPNLQVGSGAGVADGPSGTVTRVLTGQAGAGAARRRREQVHPLASAVPSLGRCSVMWPPPCQVKVAPRRSGRGGCGAAGLGVWVGRPGPRRVMPNHSANQPGHVGRKEPAGRWASGPSVTSTKIR